MGTIKSKMGTLKSKMGTNIEKQNRQEKSKFCQGLLIDNKCVFSLSSSGMPRYWTYEDLCALLRNTKKIIRLYCVVVAACAGRFQCHI